jgi:hypothetical protein
MLTVPYGSLSVGLVRTLGLQRLGQSLAQRVLEEGRQQPRQAMRGLPFQLVLEGSVTAGGHGYWELVQPRGPCRRGVARLFFVATLRLQRANQPRRRSPES